MSADERFDAIIIGAGPAGSACAYMLAKLGKSVLLVERGDTAGSKNVTGGRLYTYALELMEPGLFLQAPLERKVVREQIMMLNRTGGTTIDYVNYEFGEAVPQSYTVLRAPFDEWLAGQAEAQGAMLATGILVDELIEKDGSIIGIRAGDDELYADVVIAADGVNSFIAQKAGLISDVSAQSVGVGAKEIIQLSPEVIQERFCLEQEEGLARVVLGASDGVVGGGFFYTNKDSISLGLVLSPTDLGRSGKKIFDLLQEYKMHPAIYPLIKDGTTIEYGAHLVPELGYNGIPKKLYRNGLIVIGDAAGLVVNTGTILRGIDLAIVSGVAAARALIEAETAEEIGPAYLRQLELLQLLPTMRLYKGFHELLSMPRMFSTYPSLANEMMKVMFSVDGNLPERMDKGMLHVLRNHVTLGQLVADGWKGFRAI